MYDGLVAEYITRSELSFRTSDPMRARRAIQRRELELMNARTRAPRINPLRRLSALFARAAGSASAARQTASHA